MRWWQMNVAAIGLGLLLTGGCIGRQEIRGQHCAHLAIERHGALPPVGAYGAWTHGARCYVHLWNGRRVDEGKLDDTWRPE